jgi:Skp family chaperone for outer membrane proteins
MNPAARIARLAAALLISAACALAQVELKSDAVVFFGSASNTSAPATIDEQRVREATPEWKTIQSEGVRRGSARYRLLMAEMDKRIRDAARNAASSSSKDLVVRKGDIDDDQGKTVADLTSDVIANL